MTKDYIYNAAPHLTRWQRFQFFIWDRYGVNAGDLIGTMAAAFVTVVVLGAYALYQL